MGEVIQVDFNRKPRTVVNPRWLAFLDMMERNGVCEDDVLDVTDAVADPEAYAAADKDIQLIADVWLDNL